MIEIGLFCELLGGPNTPSLRASRCGEASDEASALAQYLDGGAVLVTSGQLVDDVLDPDRTAIALSGLRTDGVFVWPSELGYYLRTYGVELPAAIYDRARALGFEARPIGDDELIALATQFQESRMPPTS